MIETHPLENALEEAKQRAIHVMSHEEVTHQSPIIRW